eukprot:GILI01032572.1.p1 GENE.GILI01032572.1~~GILI01032572.1.p1  ORF type:complete len:117 (-),score=4.21 GILI01032572.1:222-572(-)
MSDVPQNQKYAKKASLLSIPIDKVENSDQFQPAEFDPDHNTYLADAKNRPKHGSKTHRDGDHVESRASEKAAEKRRIKELRKKLRKRDRKKSDHRSIFCFVCMILKKTEEWRSLII